MTTSEDSPIIQAMLNNQNHPWQPSARAKAKLNQYRSMRSKGATALGAIRGITEGEFPAVVLLAGAETDAQRALVYKLNADSLKIVGEIIKVTERLVRLLVDASMPRHTVLKSVLFVSFQSDPAEQDDPSIKVQMSARTMGRYLIAKISENSSSAPQSPNKIAITRGDGARILSDLLDSQGTLRDLPLLQVSGTEHTVESWLVGPGAPHLLRHHNIRERAQFMEAIQPFIYLFDREAMQAVIDSVGVENIISSFPQDERQQVQELLHKLPHLSDDHLANFGPLEFSVLARIAAKGDLFAEAQMVLEEFPHRTPRNIFIHSPYQNPAELFERFTDEKILYRTDSQLFIFKALGRQYGSAPRAINVVASKILKTQLQLQAYQDQANKIELPSGHPLERLRYHLHIVELPQRLEMYRYFLRVLKLHTPRQ